MSLWYQIFLLRGYHKILSGKQLFDYITIGMNVIFVDFIDV